MGNPVRGFFHWKVREYVIEGYTRSEARRMAREDTVERFNL